MTDTKNTPLRIEPAPNGGFIVSEAAWFSGENNRFCGPLLACSSIGEAIEFIKGRLAPVEVKAASIGAVVGAPKEAGCSCIVCQSDRARPRDYGGWAR